MSNLLLETIEKLEKHNKKLSDVKFIRHDQEFQWQPSNRNCKVDEELLKIILNFDYDNSWGGVEVNINLKLVGDDFWLERHEYDGSEWWEYKELPIYDETIACDITDMPLRED